MGPPWGMHDVQLRPRPARVRRRDGRGRSSWPRDGPPERGRALHLPVGKPARIPFEVPPRVRRGSCEMANAFPCSKFSFETRAETVTPEIVEELVATMDGKPIAVGMGLESSSSWVRRFCINKLSDASAYEVAARLLHERGVGVYANACLGSAFLSPAEAIDDARATTEWALDNGADMALVFPMHVKAHTLLDWLYQRGDYQPPSFWSLVAVLSEIKPEYLSRVNISWYRGEYGDGPGHRLT